MPVAVEVVHIAKKFKKAGYRNVFPWVRESVTALNDISLQVEKGEVFGLLGPNGAGKTTLIKILATLILPDSGTALLNGFDIYNQAQKIRKAIGYVTSEERSFYWRLTGRQNLLFFASLYNMSKGDVRRRISYLTDLLDLRKHVDRPFMNYSSGTRQRLAIARGLIYDPEILLMDEPTKSFDPISKLHLQRFVKEKLVAEQKKTILLATHDLLEAEYLCDRLGVISEGNIITTGRVDEIKHKLVKNKTFLLKFKSEDKDAISQLSKINGIVHISILSYLNSIGTIELALNDEEAISSVLAQLVHMKIGILSCIPKQSSLTEIFEKVTWQSNES